jgi:hypothetical protein
MDDPKQQQIIARFNRSFIVANLASILCVVVAAYIAGHGGQSWKWFLLVAFLTYSSKLTIEGKKPS